MGKPKLLTIVGTRPELIKLSRVIPVLDQCFNHILLHTNQNYDYELNKIFFEEMDIRKPDYCFLEDPESAIETISNNLYLVDEILTKVKPDAVLVLGDTNSALSVYAAKRKRIPIFHMEAGNRCFDARVPEEINRKIVDHLSDINMVYTEHARRYLLAEGLPADQILKTGSPMLEVLNHYKSKINSSDVLDRLKLEKRGYFVVSIHREENVDDLENFQSLINSVNAVSEKYHFPIIFSCHPRTKNRLKELKSQMHPGVQLMSPLGFFDYIHLQQNSKCTISDSGTITEEASILGFPAITIRQAHERPEGMDEGTILMSGVSVGGVIEAIELALKQFKNLGALMMVEDYDVLNVSWKVAKIISSYINFVNQKVWHKNN